MLYCSLATAQSFNFHEIRYSDAIDRSMELHGEISFYKNGLFIKYTTTNESLKYDDGNLVYEQDGKPVDIDDSKAQNIIQYFEILMLVHSGDEALLKSMFEIEKNGNETTLKPTGSIRNYVKSIELVKSEQKLKSIKLFLKNNDHITIGIENEIR